MHLYYIILYIEPRVVCVGPTLLKLAKTYSAVSSVGVTKEGFQCYCGAVVIFPTTATASISTLAPLGRAAT